MPLVQCDVGHLRLAAWTSSAVLDVWCHLDAVELNELDMETVEAEVVYLIRAAGQWPAFQTEIRFHPSSARHRKIAGKIVSHYKLP